MRCPTCANVLKLKHERANAQQSEIHRLYICEGCGSTVDTNELVTNIRRKDTSRRTDVPVRAMPKRVQQLHTDDPPASDYGELAPLYKGD